MNFVNEIDKNALDWMRALAFYGEIPDAHFDARPIQQIRGIDLRGYTQFHTFAGIGGWPLALRIAGWPEDREVWTGSCPCQPFSSAGKGKGVEDERHLWPEFLRLIAERRPATVFGEQVASAAGRTWCAGVRSDLEALGYRFAAVDICAAGVGAPHIRQRLYWVADSMHTGRPEWRSSTGSGSLAGSGGVGGLVDAVEYGPSTRQNDGRSDGEGEEPAGGQRRPVVGCEIGRVADDDARLQVGRPGSAESGRGPLAFWDDFRIVPCTDGKARRTGTRVFPLAYGLPRGVGDSGAWRKGLARGASLARRGMLKGSGNAIVPHLAAVFIRAFMETGA